MIAQARLFSSTTDHLKYFKPESSSLKYCQKVPSVDQLILFTMTASTHVSSKYSQSDTSDTNQSKANNILQNIASNFVPTASGQEEFYIKEERNRTKNLYKIQEISQLEYDWNDNGADPFSHNIIDQSKFVISSLIRQPELFPTARNSIQLEFENVQGDYLEIEITEVFFEVYQVIGNDECEYKIPSKDIEKLNEIILEFYEGTN